MRAKPENRILRVLEDETRHSILGECREVHLQATEVLSRAGEDQAIVHFPERCVISTVASFRDGATIEVANTGREGCTGLGPILGSAFQLNSDIVQVSGRALVMDTEDFLRAKQRYPAFRDALFAATRGMFQQVMVSGACNATHPAKQRLARWLLTMSDRAPDSVINLTQEFLAEILGVRRATVSEASSELRQQNLISYSRGSVTILDHSGLHDVACECYDLVADAYNRLLPIESP
ncbi:Crp/Fnr family transcriptional regulator [Sulfitobacter sp. D35]|uniref:Crp/Fnr family transcriptional regulator n=1 Tax=Sulfitobacter sp. D35 TaxID=3083252 RepID=UPI00296E4C9C|nr:Crp/Fnr family transcriptional regulator [Sulfitobacter sp. D35]MDW4499435.1 Crp/Fnr family transcriptional regulator [Sulfitobacter sp. D35]